jgi:hypothetical protein
MLKDTDTRKEYLRNYSIINKEAKKVSDAAKYAKRRLFLDTYRAEKGCACGERDIACLDFHHVGEGKEGNVSTISSWNKMVAEIEKCVVVCANCHRKLHYYASKAAGLKES